MGIFNRLKRLMAPQEQTQEERKNIYEELGLSLIHISEPTRP